MKCKIFEFPWSLHFISIPFLQEENVNFAHEFCSSNNTIRGTKLRQNTNYRVKTETTNTRGTKLNFFWSNENIRDEIKIAHKLDGLFLKSK